MIEDQIMAMCSDIIMDAINANTTEQKLILL